MECALIIKAVIRALLDLWLINNSMYGGATNYPTAPHDTPRHPTAPKFMYIYHQKGILEGQ